MENLQNYEAVLHFVSRRMNDFNQEKAFSSSDVNKKIAVFNKIILTTHEAMIYRSKDPQLFDGVIRSIIEE